jgi:Carboxypeptidase regulatory-like domain/TonB-dependent Receptor Plug Domain/TonB dependent receptor
MIHLRLVLPFIICASLAVARAQTTATGEIAGTVTDPSGAVVPNVVVTLNQTSGGTKRSITTDEAGLYRFALLSPGNYKVTFAGTGFSVLDVSGITVDVSGIQTVNVRMRMGPRTESIEVESKPEQVDEESATLGTVFSEHAIESVPLTNRNYTQLLHLSPGVVSDVENAAEVGRNTQDVYVNGMRSIDNNYQMDGTNINNFGTGRAADWLGYTGIAIPNPDAIEEFKVQTALCDAAFGRNVGANVDVITRSGTNAFHGDAFEYLRNDTFNANNFFLNRYGQPRPVMKQNQFGFAFGGPIRKGKIFSFFSYQGTRQKSGLGESSLHSVNLPPLTDDRSPAALGAIFVGQRGLFQTFFGGVGPAILADGSNINPVALKLLQYKLQDGGYLIPTPQRVVNGLGIAIFSEPSQFAEDQVIGNLDIPASAKHSLSARWFFSHDPETTGFPTPDIGGTYATPGNGTSTHFYNDVFTLRSVSTVRSSFLHEERFSWVHNSGATKSNSPVLASDIGMRPASDQIGIPLIAIPGLFTLGGGFNDGAGTTINSFQGAEQVAWALHQHDIRFGFEFERDLDATELSAPKRGGIIFPSFADFLLGLSAAENGTPFSNLYLSSATAGITGRIFRANNYASYFQDDIKLRPQLSLNLGLRWEINGQLSEINGRLANFWPEIADPIPPAAGTLKGFVVASNFPGPLPAEVLRNDNKSVFRSSAPLKNLEPRFGFAFRPFGGTTTLVVRGGYGIFYSRTSGNDVEQLVLQQPFVVLSSLAGAANSAATFEAPFPVLPSISSFPVWEPISPNTQITLSNLISNFNSPMTQEWSLNTEYEIHGYLLEVGYVGAHGTNLLRFREINQARLASPGNPINGQITNTLANIALRVPYVGLAAADGLRQIETAGSLRHDALQIDLRRRLSRGLELNVAYTYSKTLDDTPGTVGFTSIWGGFYSNDVNDPRQARGPADFNRKHRLVLAYVYDFPEKPNVTGLLARIINGWQVSGITTIQSGTPLTLLDQRAGTIYGASSTLFFEQRAQFCPGANAAELAVNGPVESKLDGFFNNKALCPPPVIGDGTGYGNIGRGVIRGPDQRNFDIALSKHFRILRAKDTGDLGFEAEFFNAFNTPQFNNPALDFGAPGFGAITATSVAPRMIQMSAKYKF